MIKSLLISVLVALPLWAVQPPYHPESAYRAPNQDYFSIRSHVYKRLSEQPAIVGTYPEDFAVPADQVTADKVQVVYTEDQLREAFIYVRDLRHMDDPQVAGFKRRSSWMYPDDGCWARASLMGLLLEQKNQPRPIKIFAFGNLRVMTKNSPYGSVTWWYHVVPGVALESNGTKEIYVLDPAMDHAKPMTLKAWTDAMGGKSANVRVALCDPKTYTPNSACQSPVMTDEMNSALSDQSNYLSAERYRLKELKRDADKELGDEPPWKLGSLLEMP